MKTFWIVALWAVLGLLTPATSTAQPILKRVEELLRDQLGGTTKDTVPGERGYLGIIADDTDDNLGVRVLEVYPDEAGARAGLAAGDVITAVDGRPIRTMDDLLGAALDKAVGSHLAMTVDRQGEVQKLQVTLGRRPDSPGNELPLPVPPAKQPPADVPSPPKLGVRSVAVTPDVQRQHNLAEPTGAHVIAVTPDSPAELAGIPLGAVITAVDRTPIHSPEELAAAIRSAHQASVEVTFVHAGKTQAVTAEIGQSGVGAGSAPLVETQARKATPGPALVPADSQPVTPPEEDRVETLERRIRELEARIERLEGERTGG